jgi:hypothetical protein
VERLVGPPGRIDAGVGIRAAGEGTVWFQGIGRIVGRAHHRDPESSQEAEGSEPVFLKASVRVVEDAPGAGGREEGVNSERALQLELGPVVQRVAQGVRDRARPGLELLPVRGVARAEALGNAVRTHGPPLVVVAVEPNLGDAPEPVVVRHQLRREMAVVVDDGQRLGEPVIEVRGCVALQEEVVVDEGSHAHARPPGNSNSSREADFISML